MQEKTSEIQGVNESDSDTRELSGPEALRESLSAMMDDEAGELELRRVVKAVPADASLSQTWQRYHLVRSALHQEVHSQPSVNLLAGIHERMVDLEKQDGQSLPSAAPRRLRSFLKLAGQGAIAAGVAALALFSASYLEMAGRDNGMGATQIASGNTDIPSVQGPYTPSELSRTVSIEGIDDAERARIQQAVYQFSGNSTQAPTFGDEYSFPQVDDNQADNGN